MQPRNAHTPPQERSCHVGRRSLRWVLFWCADRVEGVYALLGVTLLERGSAGHLLHAREFEIEKAAMRRIFSKLRAGLMYPSPARSTSTGDICPDIPFVAVGDVHGRLDLLQRIESKIAKLAINASVVFVGDYIDRGEASAQVLAYLMQRETASSQITCLMGNHEQMCLSFLKDPVAHGPLWLRNGGLQTLASYGIGQSGGSNALTSPERLEIMRDRLVNAMGPGLIGWLTRRPLLWTSGNVVVVHAGADPLIPLARQTSRSLLWGHSAFGQRPRPDGFWVVRGHTIVDKPQCAERCISIDCGAYATGHLTAAIISQGSVRFVTT